MSSNQQNCVSCLDRRRAGILLHVTSLPGPGSCGCLGPEAYRFADFLRDCGISVWQTLPIGPTQSDGSPYQTMSAHAGNHRLIALEPLVDRGWLTGTADTGTPDGKHAALHHSWITFQRAAQSVDWEELESFKQEHAYWLDDYCLFRVLHDEYDRYWWEWPLPWRHREQTAISSARKRLSAEIEYVAYEQFLFFSQWRRLRAHVNGLGIKLLGDIPIFVAHDSAEVWAHPENFDLNPDGSLRVVAGVPPDYFSATGQRWGNPLYKWDHLRTDGFRFWIDRMRTQTHLFDWCRIDHFRGFQASWEIPASEPNAIRGRWVEAPGPELFSLLEKQHTVLPLIAEDLGIITPEVDRLRRGYCLPGMRILQFAFTGDPANPHLPYHHERNSVVYTGTHDNDTSLGWFLSLDKSTRSYVEEYLSYPGEPMPLPLIRAALQSRGDLAILPMQDLLALDGEHRMNRPGTTEGNWTWRFSWNQLQPGTATKVRRMLELYGRSVAPPFLTERAP